MKRKILLAEDEIALGTIVKESLETRGFDVVVCTDGESALRQYGLDRPDILVLDVMMPRLDGFSLLKKIRQNDKFIPAIFLTAKSRTEDVVEGFGYGANDYLKKPFSMEELIVRIRALLDRQAIHKIEREYAIGKFLFDPSSQLLTINGKEEVLTYRETSLLVELVRNRNEATERSHILNTIWGNDDFFTARSMDVFISKLRKKLEPDPEVRIMNVRGFGYKLICP